MLRLLGLQRIRKILAIVLTIAWSLLMYKVLRWEARTEPGDRQAQELLPRRSQKS